MSGFHFQLGETGRGDWDPYSKEIAFFPNCNGALGPLPSSLQCPNAPTISCLNFTTPTLSQNSSRIKVNFPSTSMFDVCWTPEVIVSGVVLQLVHTIDGVRTLSQLRQVPDLHLLATPSSSLASHNPSPPFGVLWGEQACLVSPLALGEEEGLLLSCVWNVTSILVISGNPARRGHRMDSLQYSSTLISALDILNVHFKQSIISATCQQCHLHCHIYHMEDTSSPTQLLALQCTLTGVTREGEEFGGLAKSAMLSSGCGQETYTFCFRGFLRGDPEVSGVPGSRRFTPPT